jgi:hypothetical protein
MATIDKESITVKKTNDPLVFEIEFDFTDDTLLNVNEGWKSVWLHARFFYNKNWTDTEFNQTALKSMAIARRPTEESTLETTLKSKFGVKVIRINPVPDAIVPQQVKIVAVDGAVVLKTQGV